MFSLTIGEEFLCELDSFLNACHLILLPASSICEYRSCFTVPKREKSAEDKVCLSHLLTGWLLSRYVR